MKAQMFSRSVAPVGQVVFSSNNTGNLAATNWVVPDGVYEISVVIVSPSQGSASLKRGATDLLTSATTLGAGVGGGNGGAAGVSTGRGPINEAGAGGAGGYSGNGGAGGSASTSATPGNYTSNPGSSGAGGGGGGGGSGHGTAEPKGAGGYGGDVGLLGIGANGLGGSGGVVGNQTGSSGGDGSTLGGSVYGRGVSFIGGSTAGGDLRYKNSIPVTPGETLVVRSSGTTQGGYAITGSAGGIRIMWGGGRSYPSNALNM